MKTTLFLGAGASVFAGVPTTKDLIGKVRDRVLNRETWESQEAKVLAENIMNDHSEKDVEELYETIHAMIAAERLHRTIATYKIKPNASGPSRRQIQTIEFPYDSKNVIVVEETVDIDETIRALESLELTIRNTLLDSLMVSREHFGEIVTTYNKLFELVPRNIVTTNHDNVLETYCGQAGLKLVNGFKRSQHGDKRTWSGAWKGEEAALRLTKLHGSITWQKDDNDDVLELAVPGLRDTGRDVMIVPTLGEKDYSDSVFPALRNRFRKVLDETELLIVVGFSFRDPEISRMLRNRLERTDENHDPMKLLCVDPKLDGLKALIGSDVKTRKVLEPGRDVLWGLRSNRIPYVYAYQVEFGLDIMESMENVLDIINSECRS